MADTTKLVANVLDSYHRARYKFVSSIVELSNDTKNVEALYSMGVMSLLLPMTQDCIASVQYAAMVALGKLAASNSLCVKSLVQDNFLPQLARSLSSTNRHDRRAATYCFLTIAKNPEYASNLLDFSILPALSERLMDGSPAVKETAASALAHIAKNGRDSARQVIETGAIGLLNLCLQESNTGVQRAALTALAEISSHGEKEARTVLDSKTLDHLKPTLQMENCQLKNQACFLLGSIVKHNVSLAEAVLNNDSIFLCTMASCLVDSEPSICFNVANTFHRLVRKSKRLTYLILKLDCVDPMMKYVQKSEISKKLPGVLCLGYFGQSSSEVAERILKKDGIKPLLEILHNKQEERLKSAIIWVLKCLGSHGPAHAKSMSEAGALIILSTLCSTKPSSLNSQQREDATALQISLIQNLTCISSFTQLLHCKSLSEVVLESLLKRIMDVLSMDESARNEFRSNGGLKRLHDIHHSPYLKNKTVKEDEIVMISMMNKNIGRCIDAINMNYPFEMSTAYDAEYSECLLNNLHEITSIMVPSN